VYLLGLAQLVLASSMRSYDVAVLVAMYSVVTYRPQLPWGVFAGVGAAIGVVLVAAVDARATGNFWGPLQAGAAVTVAVWVTGYGVRTRRLYVATIEERAAALERERDHLARLAAADERAAIARELHDVVAHSLSVMIVQADGASYAPDRSHDALAMIAATGRDALDDMHRIVGVLRGASDEFPDRRRVGLPELLERAGLQVALETVGTPDGLSAAEELTTYRIVQESLTNALRHAGPDAAVTLRLVYAPDKITVEVCDDGAGPLVTAGSPAGGHGVVGMRERVALHGGDLAAGPQPGGGWRVEATIPRGERSAR